MIGLRMLRQLDWARFEPLSIWICCARAGGSASQCAGKGNQADGGVLISLLNPDKSGEQQPWVADINPDAQA